MITIEIPERKIKKEIPSTWEELTQEQYCFVIELILLLEHEKIDLLDAKLLFLKKCLGLTKFLDKRYSQDVKDNFYSVLLILANKVNFFFTQQEIDGVIQHVFSIDILKNPVEKIVTGKGTVYGPVFEIRDGIILTDITADEFNDGLDLFNLFAKTGQEVYLNYLTSVFFREKTAENEREAYFELLQKKNIERFRDVNKSITYGFYLFFASLMKYLTTKSPWKVLWSSEKKNDNPVNLIYTLLEYGSLNEIKRLGLVDYFNLLVKNLTDGVKEMQSAGMQLPEISDKTGIPLKTLTSILN